MRKSVRRGVGFAFFVGLLSSGVLLQAASKSDVGYAGSQSCRSCHERFYQLWAPSHHGTAMLSYNDTWAMKTLQPQTLPLMVGEESYQAFVGENEGWVLRGDAEQTEKMNITHVLGGKYVYYFLTKQQGGKLQTLPVAYDIKKKTWFDMAASGVRHGDDDPVDWQDSVYTFNTSCYGCHVSQVDNSYDVKNKEYTTSWAEDGINCETCHGPSGEHVSLYTSLSPDSSLPKDSKLLGGKGKFTAQENTNACVGCHSQSIPISKEYIPGENFYDHYDLTTLEDEDFYADGRDIGENYTFGTWSLSPCLASSKISCITCHTSSGRFRQKQNPNQACLPCHGEKNKNLSAHTNHKVGSEGSVCISCHMVKTTFARMDRSDHSMLPPAPAASLAFGSPNSCTVCHDDKDYVWADKIVREWKGDSYQNKTLYRGSLVAEARQGNWTRLVEMLEYIASPNSNEIFVTSLIRLLEDCADPRKWPIIIGLLETSESPLVRSSAASALTDYTSREAASSLVMATEDPVLLVRIRAAAALAGMPIIVPEGDLKVAVEGATSELLEALTVRPDMWNSYYNLGNFYTRQKNIDKAIEAYLQAVSLSPRAVAPRVNLAILYGGDGEIEKAKQQLEKAYALEPHNSSVLFNLALIYVEVGDNENAKKYFAIALEENPSFARAASNLAILVAEDSPADAVVWAKRAYDIDPTPISAFTLAYYMKNSGKMSEAQQLLFTAVERWPNYPDLYLLLSEIVEAEKERQYMLEAIQHALDKYRFHPDDRRRLQQLLQ